MTEAAHVPAHFAAHYRCVRGCEGRYDVFSVMYRCPTCAGLLEVVHDHGALSSAYSGAGWRDIFNARRGAGGREAADFPPSGVWSKHEWVLPQIEPGNAVSLGEGFSPLVPSVQLGKSLGIEDLWVKQCGVSHTGSFKDLGMTVLVSAVSADDGAARRCPVRAVACASTGDTSAALAAYAATAGIPAHGLSAEGQDHHRAAHPAHRQRQRASWRWTPTSTAACGSSRK
jgi:threonine synthase